MAVKLGNFMFQRRPDIRLAAIGTGFYFPYPAEREPTLLAVVYLHVYDHSFPLRSKAPKEMKLSVSIAASHNLLECT